MEHEKYIEENGDSKKKLRTQLADETSTNHGELSSLPLPVTELPPK